MSDLRLDPLRIIDRGILAAREQDHIPTSIEMSWRFFDLLRDGYGELFPPMPWTTDMMRSFKILGLPVRIDPRDDDRCVCTVRSRIRMMLDEECRL